MYNFTILIFIPFYSFFKNKLNFMCLKNSEHVFQIQNLESTYIYCWLVQDSKQNLKKFMYSIIAINNFKIMY